MRILIIEDNDLVADAIVRGLQAANFVVDRVSSAESAQTVLTNQQFDLAVIDIGLPGMDGLAFLRQLRKLRKNLPVLILTARDTLNDKVQALDIGADDYLSKPFELAELSARCRALLRRASAAVGGTVIFGRMTMNLAGRHLSIDNQAIELTMREWLLLECLVRHIGQVISKERLLQAITNLDQELTPNAVEVHISRLRSKLEGAVTIRALRGLGYRLDEAKSP